MNKSLFNFFSVFSDIFCFTSLVLIALVVITVNSSNILFDLILLIILSIISPLAILIYKDSKKEFFSVSSINNKILRRKRTEKNFFMVMLGTSLLFFMLLVFTKPVADLQIKTLVNAYLMIEALFILVSSIALVNIFIENYKAGTITFIQVEIYHLYISLFSILFVGIFYMFYFIFSGNPNATIEFLGLQIDMNLLGAITALSLAMTTMYQIKWNSVYYFLMGATTQKNPVPNYHKLPKPEQYEVLRKYITKRNLVQSGILNGIAGVFLIKLMVTIITA